jgi:hypothetical protein
MGKAKQVVAEIIGDGKLFDEGRRDREHGDDRATRRPGPFAQDPSRTPPDKADRENDYGPEKKIAGDAAKR